MWFIGQIVTEIRSLTKKWIVPRPFYKHVYVVGVQKNDTILILLNKFIPASIITKWGKHGVWAISSRYEVTNVYNKYYGKRKLHTSGY